MGIFSIFKWFQTTKPAVQQPKTILKPQRERLSDLAIDARDKNTPIKKIKNSILQGKINENSADFIEYHFEAVSKSTGEFYNVSFKSDGIHASFKCDCTAGNNLVPCKHRLAFFEGDSSNIRANHVIEFLDVAQVLLKSSLWEEVKTYKTAKKLHLNVGEASGKLGRSMVFFKCN